MMMLQRFKEIVASHARYGIAKQVNNDGEDDDYCKVEQVIMVMIINMMIMIIL